MRRELPIRPHGLLPRRRDRIIIHRIPVGNIRKLPAGGYQLRFRRHGLMRTAPELFRTRPEADQALWKMADDGRADCNHDRRFGALVLLATFALGAGRGSRVNGALSLRAVSRETRCVPVPSRAATPTVPVRPVQRQPL